MSSAKSVLFNTPYSSLFDAQENTAGSFKSSPQNCPQCGLSLFVNDSKYSLLGSINPNIFYKEPVFHYTDLVEYILKNCDQQNVRLIPIGHKNSQLVKLLEESCRSSSCSQLSTKELYDATLSNESLIYLAIRHFEHINDAILLKGILSTIGIGDALYVECLDFYRLFQKQNYSYFWRERVSYPTKTYYIRYFRLLGFEIEYLREYSEPEPFFCFVCRRVGKIEPDESRISTLLKCYSLPLKKTQNILSHRISQIIKTGQQVNIFGIGHKALTLVDFIRQRVGSSSINLYDGSPQKAGTYYGEYLIKDIDIANILIAPDSINIISFSGSFAEIIAQTLTLLQPNAKIKSIDDYYQFGNDGKN